MHEIAPKTIKETIKENLKKLSLREEKIIRLRFGISEDDDNINDFPSTNLTEDCNV